MKTILIVMEGGIIQSIAGIPRGTEITVRDYDVDGVDLNDYLADGRLFVGPGGDLCTQFYWSHDPEEHFTMQDGTRAATPQDLKDARDFEVLK